MLTIFFVILLLEMVMKYLMLYNFKFSKNII